MQRIYRHRVDCIKVATRTLRPLISLIAAHTSGTFPCSKMNNDKLQLISDGDAWSFSSISWFAGFWIFDARPAIIEAADTMSKIIVCLIQIDVVTCAY